MKPYDSFVRAASLEDLHPLRGTLVTIEGHDIALFLHEGIVYAISNVCAHQHFSLLHKGERDGCVVTCPMHGWSFDVTTGRAVQGNGMVPTFRAEIRGTAVYVEVVESAPAW
jgi:nitrite reductase/ring-hydroxylating ferredoxin subunit